MTPVPFNKNAIFSLASAILSVLSFCIGTAPLPLTALACYPLSLLSSAAALVSGLVALDQIRRRGERGNALALSGVWIGGLTLLLMLCIVSVVLLFFSNWFAYLLRQQAPIPSFHAYLQILSASSMLVSGSG